MTDVIASLVGGLADALEDRDVVEEVVRWINRTYDNEETNRDYRTALRLFGRRTNDADEDGAVQERQEMHVQRAGEGIDIVRVVKDDGSLVPLEECEAVRRAVAEMALDRIGINSRQPRFFL